MKIVEQDWTDFRGKDSVALSLDKEEQYTISDLIKLLESAKEKFGDRTIMIQANRSAYGFKHVCFNHEYDEREKYGESAYDEAFVSLFLF